MLLNFMFLRNALTSVVRYVRFDYVSERFVKYCAGKHNDNMRTELLRAKT